MKKPLGLFRQIGSRADLIPLWVTANYIPISQTPLPSTLLLLGSGLVGMLVATKKKSARKMRGHCEDFRINNQQK
jgi:PEP-CTERM motif